MSAPAAARVVLQLTIELPANAEALAALAEILGVARAVPGSALSVPADVLPPAPESTPDPTPPLRLDPRARSAFRRGEPLSLTRLEFDLLLYLGSRPNTVHRRSTLLERVWGVGEPYSSRTVDVHIRRLRDKLGPDSSLITTVRGVGYRFDGVHPVTVTAD